MNIFSSIIKSLVSIVVLFFLTKMMGKKQMSQLSMYDYIVGITIGSVVAEISTNLEADFFLGIVVMVVFSLISILISFLSCKSIRFRRFVTGGADVLIEDGKIIMEGLKKAKIDVNDLLQEARINNYFDISKVEYALMESNGKISFLLKSKYNNVTPHDMKLKVDYEGLCSNLVLDGVVMKNNLKLINKDEKWLKTRLEKMGYDDIRDLLLVSCDSKENLAVYKNDVKSKMEGCIE